MLLIIYYYYTCDWIFLEDIRWFWKLSSILRENVSYDHWWIWFWRHIFLLYYPISCHNFCIVGYLYHSDASSLLISYWWGPIIFICVYIYVYIYIYIYIYIYVTGPAKIGHICAQILHYFSNFNLTLLRTYLIKLLELIQKFIRNYIKLAEVF